MLHVLYDPPTRNLAETNYSYHRKAVDTMVSLIYKHFAFFSDFLLSILLALPH